MNDFVGAFATFKEAEAKGEADYTGYYEIVDIRNPYRVYWRRTLRERQKLREHSNLSSVVEWQGAMPGEWIESQSSETSAPARD